MTHSRQHLLPTLLFAPDLEFHVKRAHGVNEDEQKDRVFGAIEVANAPRKRNDRQMDQVRVEGGATDAAHNRDAEEPRQESLARKEAQHEHAVNENREAMVHKVVVTGIGTGTHEEETSVQCEEQQSLRKSAHIILLEKIEGAFVMEAVKDHAEQVLENANRGEHVEEAVLGIESLEPEIVRRAEHDRPKDSRDKHGAKQHP